VRNLSLVKGIAAMNAAIMDLVRIPAALFLQNLVDVGASKKRCPAIKICCVRGSVSEQGIALAMLAREDVVMEIVLLALRFVGSGLNAGTTNALHHVTEDFVHHVLSWCKSHVLVEKQLFRCHVELRETSDHHGV